MQHILNCHYINYAHITLVLEKFQIAIQAQFNEPQIQKMYI